MNSRREAQQHGGILPLVVFTLMVLLGMAALSIDVQRLALAKQDLQNVADAAALAGGARLRLGMDEQAAKQVALDVAASNTVLGKSAVLDPDVDIQVGTWDADTQQIVPWSPALTAMAVQATARCTNDSPNGPVPMIFAPIFGLDSVEITASAAAGVAVSDQPRSSLDFIVIQDGSGSFEEEWDQAIAADMALCQLVNNVSINNDSTGFVAFNDAILNHRGVSPDDYYKRWYKKWERHWYWSGGRWRYYWDYTWEYEWVLRAVLTPLTLELTELQQGIELPAEVEEIYGLAAGTTPTGYTNPGIALEWAIDDLLDSGHPDCDQVIVLVSDGMPFGADESTTEQYRNYAIAQADRAETEGIRIHTVTLTAEEYGEYGYGGADFEFNKSLTRNGGYAFRTADPEELKALLITVGAIEVGHGYLFK